ncbi:MAG: hypothetical protein HKN60_04435 [Rhizobiales bacterium]|nr:hypothetical protein [Hyphomicrobiales bacterium]
MGEFDAARAQLDVARNTTRTARHDAAARKAQLIVEEARIDILDARILEAADKFNAAARLVPFDPAAKFKYQRGGAHPFFPWREFRQPGQAYSKAGHYVSPDSDPEHVAELYC